MKTSLALLDFDGTITDRDTLFDFIIHVRGWPAFCRGIMRLLPTLVLCKAGLRSRKAAKEQVLSYFFGGMEEAEFQRLCHVYVANRLPEIIRAGALEKIRWHQASGDRVVVVTASPEHWVGPWAAAHGLEVIATRLEVADSKLTGKIPGENCQGKEKVSRIRACIDLTDYEKVYTYGDTPGDLHFLRLGAYRYYKPFRGSD